MRKLFSNVKTWWNNKAYEQKNKIGAYLQFAITFPLLFCMLFLNAPLLQLALSLGLIAVSLLNMRRSLKHIQHQRKEEEEKIAELKKLDAEKKIKHAQETHKHSYDKDTQEALQSLFGENEKSDDAALMEVEKDDKNGVQTFNNTFNK